MTTKTQEPRVKRILAAAVECVAEKGTDGATLEDIAARAGVSKGLLLYHYGSKLELIAAASATAAAERAARLNDVGGTRPSLKRLEALFELAIVPPVPGVASWRYFMEIWIQSTRRPELRVFPNRGVAHARETIVPSIEAGIANGEFRDDIDPVLVADLLAALLTGLGVHTTVASEELSVERARDVVKLALSMFRP